MKLRRSCAAVAEIPSLILGVKGFRFRILGARHPLFGNGILPEPVTVSMEPNRHEIGKDSDGNQMLSCAPRLARIAVG
jgi:hypothetical protein